MRNSFWRTAGFVGTGAVIGTLAGQLLVHQVPVLGKETVISFQPSADLAVLKFNLAVTLRVNWLTLVGAVAGFFVARRLK